MIITNIQLNNWKNFSYVNVKTDKRVFILGPNASGKSNFLDALRFLRDVSQDGLNKAVESRGGIKAVRYLCARRPSDVSITVNIDDTLSYQLSFNANNNGMPIVSHEKVSSYINGQESIILNRPDKDDEQDSMRLTQTALQQVNINKNFREIVNFFISIQYRHILPQLVRDPVNFSIGQNKNDPYGRDLISQIWNASPKFRESRLKKINDVLAIAVPQLDNLSVELDVKTGLPHLAVKYTHWRPNAGRQNESELSDGTLRLLALLWSVFDAEGPLLLEEPELSLHEEIIVQLPELIMRLDKTRKKTPRQIFISTHSKALLTAPGIGGNEVIRLEPGKEGTIVHMADEVDNKLLEEGLCVADVILPKTSPFSENRTQLSQLL